MIKFDFSPPPDTRSIPAFRVLAEDYMKLERIAEVEHKALKTIAKGLMMHGLKVFEKEHPEYFKDKTLEKLERIHDAVNHTQ